jgi:anaerobic magnesium-protoporphyrin IX monomethyl ester cyclase
MGGYHPTFNFKEVLEEDYIDFVIIGEGEYTLLELSKTLGNGGDPSNVKGIAFDGVVTPARPLITDLDSLPLPARHLLPMDSYKLLNMKTNMSTMITSRGCPMQCSFCSSAALHGSKLRLRSIENIVDEMEYLVNELQIETIAFRDDTFTLNKKRVYEICEEIHKRDLKVLWGCTARVDTLDEDVLKIMREAGCITIFMGVESADQQLLDEVNKQTTVEKIKNAFEISRKEKIRTIASVVLGMPGDTHESVKKTINFVKDLNPSYAIFSLATPYPGTKFYQQTFEKDLIKVKDWSKYTLISPILETVDFSLEELKKLQSTAFKKFYLRPAYIIRQVIMDGPILIKTFLGVIRNVM